MPYSRLETAGRIRREAIAVKEVMEALERAVDLIDEFDEARKKRHRTIYDYRKATRREASHALKVAQRLIEAVELKLTEKGLLTAAEGAEKKDRAS